MISIAKAVTGPIGMSDRTRAMTMVTAKLTAITTDSASPIRSLGPTAPATMTATPPSDTPTASNVAGHRRSRSHIQARSAAKNGEGCLENKHVGDAHVGQRVDEGGHRHGERHRHHRAGDADPTERCRETAPLGQPRPGTG